MDRRGIRWKFGIESEERDRNSLVPVSSLVRSICQRRMQIVFLSCI